MIDLTQEEIKALLALIGQLNISIVDSVLGTMKPEVGSAIAKLADGLEQDDKADM